MIMIFSAIHFCFKRPFPPFHFDQTTLRVLEIYGIPLLFIEASHEGFHCFTIYGFGSICGETPIGLSELE